MEQYNITVRHEYDIEDTDSDAEFWKDLSERPDLSILENDANYYVQPEQKTQRPDENTLSVPIVDRVLETCRQARQVDIENVKAVARAKGRKLVEKLTKQMVAQFAKKRAKLEDQIDDLKTVIACKDGEIQKLCKQITEQECLILLWRVPDETQEETNESAVKLPNQSPALAEPKSLLDTIPFAIPTATSPTSRRPNSGSNRVMAVKHRQEVAKLTAQMKSLENLVNMYHQSVADHQEKEQSAIEAKQAMESSTERQIQELEAKILHQDQQRQFEVENLRQTIASMKASNKSEWEILQALIDRKQSTISELKKQLKDCQQVISRPRLMAKIESKVLENQKSVATFNTNKRSHSMKTVGDTEAPSSQFPTRQPSRRKFRQDRGKYSHPWNSMDLNNSYSLERNGSLTNRMNPAPLTTTNKQAIFERATLFENSVLHNRDFATCRRIHSNKTFKF